MDYNDVTVLEGTIMIGKALANVIFAIALLIGASKFRITVHITKNNKDENIR